MPTLLSVKQVAEILGVSDRTVRHLCQRGELPFHRVGDLIRIDRADLNEYLTSVKVGG